MKIGMGRVRVMDVFPLIGSAENAGVVTVPVGGIQVLTLAMPDVVAGMVFRVDVSARMLKGGTAGLTVFTVDVGAGTATIQCINDRPNSQQQLGYQVQNTTNRWDWSVFFRVVTGGTLTLELTGLSTGSDGTVAIGDAQLAAQGEL